MKNGSEIKEKESNRDDLITSSKMFSFAVDFAFMIAVPLLAFIYLGKWIDSRYGTKYFVIVGILLALALSVFMIYRKLKEIKNTLK